MWIQRFLLRVGYLFYLIMLCSILVRKKYSAVCVACLARPIDLNSFQFVDIGKSRNMSHSQTMFRLSKSDITPNWHVADA